MGKKYKQYQHRVRGDIMKVEVRDSTYRIVYRNSFNIKDKKAMLNHLTCLEKFSDFSILQLVREKLKIGEWI